MHFHFERVRLSTITYCLATEQILIYKRQLSLAVRPQIRSTPLIFEPTGPSGTPRKCRPILPRRYIFGGRAKVS